MVLQQHAHIQLTVLLGTTVPLVILSRIGCLPCLIAKVSVNSGLTVEENETHSAHLRNVLY